MAGAPGTETVTRAGLGRIGRQLGRGGQADIHLLETLRLPDVPGELVLKTYRSPHPAPHDLRRLVGKRSAMTAGEKRALDARAVWPVRVVEDRNDVVGVVLPLIPGSFMDDIRLPTARDSTASAAINAASGEGLRESQVS